VTHSANTTPVGPEAWVRAIGGQPVVASLDGQRRPLEFGHFRFPGAPELFAAPLLDRHYLSMTFAGATGVERDLDGERAQADFAPGQCLIMAAGRDNRWSWSRPTEEIHFYLCPDYLEAMADEAGAPCPRLVERFAFADATLARLAAAILGEVGQGGVYDRLWCDSAAQLFAAHVLRRHCEHAAREPRRGGLSGHQLRRVTDFVADNMAGEIGLEDLCRQAGVSRFHFARMFKQSTGETPHRWLTARRIEAARTLLRATDKPVGAVAADTGFASQSHFGQCFRRATGLTPSQWRRRNRH
jgi:AraC family transcriptional regulator